MTTSPHDMLITSDWIYFFDDYNQRMVAFSRDFKEFKSWVMRLHSGVSIFLTGMRTT